MFDPANAPAPPSSDTDWLEIIQDQAACELLARRGQPLVVRVLPGSTDDVAATRARLRELSALRPSLIFELHTGDTIERFHAPSGLSGLVAERCEGLATRLPYVARMSASAPGPDGEIRAEIALQWLEHGDGEIRSFVNGARTTQHGTHLTGFVDGLIKALEEEGLERNLLHYKMPQLTRKRVLPGVVACLRFEAPGPIFSSFSRVALASREASPLFEQLTRRKVRGLCHEHPGLVEALLQKAMEAPARRAL